MDTALQLQTFVYPFGVSSLKGSNPLTELFAQLSKQINGIPMMYEIRWKIRSFQAQAAGWHGKIILNGAFCWQKCISLHPRQEKVLRDIILFMFDHLSV